MDEQGRPEKWWARLLFERREHTTTEFRLGMAVVGVALVFTWLIFWTYIPTLIYNVGLGIFNGISWVAGLFSGSGNNPNDVAPVLTPDVTAIPSPSPSPSPLPSPFPSPSPSPSPFPR
jgi:hypothetical protein